jgi:hypothetical protein
MPFKVRICIEGIPRHARQPSTICNLLPQDALFEGMDSSHRSDNEANCCCVMVWSRNPDNILKEGGLRLEELSDRPTAAWHFCQPGGGDRAPSGPWTSEDSVLRGHHPHRLSAANGGCRGLAGASFLSVEARVPR